MLLEVNIIIKNILFKSIPNKSLYHGIFVYNLYKVFIIVM